MYKLVVISQERLKIEVKLLLSTNRKSYVPRRLAQQRMNLSDLEWSFHNTRVTSLTCNLEIILRLRPLCPALSYSRWTANVFSQVRFVIGDRRQMFIASHRCRVVYELQGSNSNNKL